MIFSKNVFSISLFLLLFIAPPLSATDWETLDNQAFSAYQEGDYQKAMRLAKQALELARKQYGENHQNTLNSLNSIAMLHSMQGDYQQAEPLFKQALEARTRLFGEKHPDTLMSMNNLALLYQNQGRYGLAEPLYKKLVTLSRQVMGEEHQDTLMAMNNLATFYEARGHYQQAEPLHRQVLEARTRIFGERDADTLMSMNNLASLYHTQGHYRQAEPLYEKALKLRKEVLGEKHPDTLESISNLATLYQELGRYQLARPLVERELELSKDILGEKHPDTLISINNLASLYQSLGYSEQAGPLYRQALTLSEQVLGAEHPDTLVSINNLGYFHQQQRNHAKAESLYKKALRLNRQILGDNHPDTLLAIENLAFLYQQMENWDEAGKFWHQGLRLSNRTLERLLWGAGEKTRQSYLLQQGFKRNNLLSLYSFRKLSEEALYFSLSRKGLLLRISSQLGLLAKQSDNPAIRQQVARFNALRAELSALILSGKASKTEIRALEEKINHAEMLLSQKLSRFRRNRVEVTVNQVLEKLQSGQALIDFLVYREVDLKTRAYKGEQVMALIAERGGVQLIKLGELLPIAATLKTYRQAIDPSYQGAADQYFSASRQQLLTQASKKLYKQLWQPLEEYLQGKTTLYLIPDSLLHLLPFKALQNDEGRYLAERYKLVFLASARDLVIPPPNAANTQSSIFANPEYGETASMQEGLLRSVGRNLDEMYFSPLEGSQKEGDSIRGLMQDASHAVQLYAGRQASEAQLNALTKPQILHLATHGFFQEDLPEVEAETKAGSSRKADSTRSMKYIANPLTRSGLAFTDANQGIQGIRQQDGSDGILTALEVLSLDLDGTALVTLSACETGVGEIQVGEGVYSLNRAFQEAGAKTVLSTLWEISDEATNLFMQSFYRRFLNGVEAQKALQQTQQEFILHQELNDPFFWAGFVMIGRD